MHRRGKEGGGEAAFAAHEEVLLGRFFTGYAAPRGTAKDLAAELARGEQRRRRRRRKIPTIFVIVWSELAQFCSSSANGIVIIGTDCSALLCSVSSLQV